MESRRKTFLFCFAILAGGLSVIYVLGLFSSSNRQHWESDLLDLLQVVFFSAVFFGSLIGIDMAIYKTREKIVNKEKNNFFVKSNMVLLITGSVVWLLVVYSLWADASWHNFKKGMVLFGLIPVILANGWFFFKYFKNNEK